jgi:hypothetical protein
MRSGKNDVPIRIHLHVKYQDLLAEQIAFGNRDTAVRQVTWLRPGSFSIPGRGKRRFSTAEWLIRTKWPGSESNYSHLRNLD